MSSDREVKTNGTLQDACREARHTVDQQVEKIHREDRNAVLLFRANLIFLSLVASAVAFSVQSNDVSVYQFGNTHLVLGSLAVFLSSLIAVMTYTASNLRMGLRPAAINDAYTMTRNQYLTKLSREYQSWVKTNQKAHRLNAYTLNAANILTLGSMLFFFGGVAVGILSIKGTILSYGLLVVEVLLFGGVLVLVSLSDNILYFFVEEGVEQ